MKLRLQEKKKRFYQQKLSDLDLLYFSNDQRQNKESKNQPYLTSNVFIMATTTSNRKNIYVSEKNLMFDLTISSNLFGIIYVENRISKMVNFEHGTEMEKQTFGLVACVGQRRNSKSPYRKVLKKKFTMAITDGRKRGPINPMKHRFFLTKVLGTATRKIYGKG